jgi:hypothetical protein
MSVNLYHPAFRKDGTGCAFDLTPGTSGLGKGTPEFINGIFEFLEIEARAETWTIHPFCSPFFATSQKTFRDRICTAWRVDVDFQKALDPVPELKAFGPWEVDVVDETYQGEEEWTSRQAVVIGNFTFGRWLRVRKKLDKEEAFAPVIDAEVVKYTSWIDQARLDLGTLEFPGDEEKVLMVSDELQKRKAAVTSADTPTQPLACASW